ncbi:DUF134 domain-containing protein [Anaeromicropila populeti]|uniref:UPF0251 protein SAMN05661086_03471 n=1 Tax=Anaeromicropila populeti TaxID=37658 RepID=A0A1I6LPC7_9FIRM|nr:DUF134 domain-containing protein [Anaeromicropila populeti]SFS05336.1 Predicted DNA-binding protein, UPF0251 family [Anaeromicropila populeti]
MPRPTKWRKIENIPAIPYFIPAETDVTELPENILKLEELEALRLKDLEGLEQEECAAKMEVSRPTFQRILLSAREKVADSLVNGKVIRIEGGNFTRNICPVKCTDCGKEWSESYENIEMIKHGQYQCPHCGSVQVQCMESCKGKFCHKNCWKNRERELL